MADKRELILARLAVTLSSIPVFVGTGNAFFWRNRGELETDKRPAVVLLDGTESATSITDMPRGRRMAMAPAIATMTPQIFYLAKNRTPNNEDIGPELNTMRARIVKALTDDVTLLGLLGDNGGITYRGTDTDMQSGNSVAGELQLFLAFDYVLNSNDL